MIRFSQHFQSFFLSFLLFFDFSIVKSTMFELFSKFFNCVDKQRVSKKNYMSNISETFKPDFIFDFESALTKSFDQLNINFYFFKSVEQFQWFAKHNSTKFLKNIENMRIVMKNNNISYIVINWNVITKFNKKLILTNSILIFQNEDYLKKKKKFIT